MSTSGSLGPWIGVALLGAFVVLMLLSAWLRGVGAFVLMVFCLVAGFGALTFEALQTQQGVLLSTTLLLYAGVSGGLFYIVGGRYLTQTPWSDLTYQSRDALIRYIRENEVESPLATVLRLLGPALMVLLGFAVVVGVLATKMGVAT